ncbi:MAG: carbon-nitrogen hydrolase family protein [Gammaproteobacteria bacterium]
MIAKIASAQYDIGFLGSWENYCSKINRWVEEAVAERADVLLFPEYGSMELASLFEKNIYTSLEKQLQALQTLHDAFVDLYRTLALQHRLIIQPGTFPVQIDNGEYRNRAYLLTPDGGCGYQEKLQMTRFENEQWLIRGGSEIKVFTTEFGKIGINVCYDSEFPMLARKQAEAGAVLILVPSCTDTLAGYHRVKIGCQARALENQCYVVQSPTVGLAPWSEAVDVNVGAAAVFTPVDYGFPDNGILAAGELNTAQWVYAELDLTKVAEIRETGQVFNYRDWPGQFKF